MRKTVLALATALALTTSATAMAASQDDPIKVGVILGFTGPIESLTPGMAGSAELALKEASESGLLLGGKKIKPVRADTTCVDAAVASSAAERLVTSEKVVAIVGAACSGASTAIATKVAAANGVAMISPSSTSPALTTVADNGMFFRTAPSDARQGEVLADIAIGRGIKEVAVTYTNNDYGKGLAESFGSAFKAKGGKVVMSAAHEDGKADYSAEVGALSASGAKELVVLGYLDQGGRGVIQAALDADAFSRFILADGMVGDSLIKNVDGDLEGTFGTLPGSESAGAKMFLDYAKENGADGDGPYRAESYDAAALLVLAMQAGKSADRASIAKNIMKVANAPGEKILPGQLAKALKILAEGGEVDYDGASNVEFSEEGEAAGSYKEVEVAPKFNTVKVH
ncbi:MAG: branched-chain amino acid ABC transporter substrate-binding protein [Proteobacteria bacterium]|nr:MAG: branched-chain amino acid ABC transporter substrate-binding protein [Pseudomonadota bacterium]